MTIEQLAAAVIVLSGFFLLCRAADWVHDWWRDRRAALRAMDRPDVRLVGPDQTDRPMTPDELDVADTIRQINALNDQIRSLVADRDALAKSMAKWD